MPKENRKLKVFLCHSNEDKQEVRELYSRLIADGFDAWLDEEKLVPGHEWDLEIRKAMRGSDVILICLSNSSVTKSGYVQKEIRIAIDLADEQPEGKIYLIPAILENCLVPSRLGRWQWVDLSEERGYDKLKGSLAQCVNDLKIRTTSDKLSQETDEKELEIPLLGQIGYGRQIPTLSDRRSKKQFGNIRVANSLLPSHSKNLFAIEAKGDSLIDAMISDGDIVILESTATAQNGDMVAIWLPQYKESTLKYFYKEKDGYRLQPANPTMKPLLIKQNEKLEIRGKVVMVVRNTNKSRRV